MPDYSRLDSAGPTDTDHVRGDPDAAVTLLEFGDYECPYCAAAAPVLRRLVEGSDGGVRLVFRNYPVPDVHAYALTAALAAEASAPHGVFWAMHDLLFTHQSRLTDADLRSYADSLGIDGAQVVGDAAQPFGDKVEADFASGVELGVGGTPWLLVDGEVYQGRLDLADLQRAIGTSTRPSRFVPRTRRQAR
ncbi:MAG TPA: thioredoxin domain-containing protein [Nocardioidaceae bacterium]|nr:thioredoxin domain-containing protein [Nocardioidaceae bacterium]